MKKGIGLIILAGILWGSMGLFVRPLNSYGFTSEQVVALRLTVAAVCFSLVLLIKDPHGLRIQKKDIPLFLGLGLCSVLFFTVCYFTAIRIMPISLAAILLYTSPIWVMLMSIAVFREKLTKRKLAALALSFAGCVLVSGVSGGAVTFGGLLVGLGAGIGYGLYSILGTVALRKYSPYTVTTYTFVIAAAGSWFVCGAPQMLQTAAAFPNKGFLACFVLATGVVTAVIPFLAYTVGLESVEASKAAILATVEPMVATLLGALVYKEGLTLWSGLGVACILGTVFILNKK